MHQEAQQVEKGTLYVVATPIGNLRDISLRALDVLRGVDLIAAEDTRNTSHLLSHFGIAAKLLPLHEHNERSAAQKLIVQLQQGMAVAYVSDAGTPAVSDPGALLVAAARQVGIKVSPIPGANAAIGAISAAGIAAAHFLFYGFLPHQGSERRRELVALKPLPYTLVFYESPHRVLESVRDMAAMLDGERTITFARELTKLFETIHACRLDAALEWLEADPNRQRGEFVLLVSGAAPPSAAGLSEDALRTLNILLAEMPLKQAVKLAAEISGEKKNALYEAALAIKSQGEV